jgi:hypothetical protein
MATPRDDDDDVDGTALEGDRTGAHPVDVLGELPIDGNPTSEEQLMPDSELEPRQVQGDRFDVNDDDLGTAPDLEDDPDAPDLQPDHVERLTESGFEEDLDSDDEDLESEISARPTVEATQDAIEPDEPR